MTARTGVFDAYGRYYDLLYRDKDYSAEVAYVVGLLSRYGCAGRELLEFGSGTGKHGRLLAERGYQVTGIERSDQMAARAQEQSSPGFRCQVGDVGSVRLGRTFDAVLSLFHVVSYQVTNQAVGALFRSAATHLRPDGLFIFDVWYSPAVYTQQPQVRVKRLADNDLDVTRIAEPTVRCNENRVDVEYSLFIRESAKGGFETVQETHSMRHFSLPELDLLAAIHGFQRVGAEEFLSGNMPSSSTWGVCLVLSREGYPLRSGDLAGLASGNLL